MAVVAAGALANEEAGSWTTARAAGVDFRGRIVDGVLHAEVTGPTHGWVAVGLNLKPDLAGSLLVMAAVGADGVLVVEEHIARPPSHPRRADLGGKGGLLVASGSEAAGPRTRVQFSLRLDTGDGLVPVCGPARPVYLTLAWSQEDDFGHHSSARELVPVVFR